MSADQAFAFKHALVQDEAYASLLRDERRRLHRRVADALCADTSAPSEVIAHHYTRAGDAHHAVDYWMKAGREAGERFAFVEASSHLRNAIEQAVELPPSPQRDELELQLQYSLGNALIAAKGFGASETGQAFQQALALCQKFDGSPQTTMVLNGIVGFHVNRDEFEQARRVGEELLAAGQREGDISKQLLGRRALGISLFLIGELGDAREHLRDLLELYDSASAGPTAIPPVFAPDIKATSQAFLTLASILLGDIGGGLALGRAALLEAEELRHPHSVCYVLDFLAGAHALCREPEAACVLAERVLRLAGEHGFPVWSAGGHMLHGWAQVELGASGAGLAEIRQSVDALEATGALTWVHFAHYLLAQSLAKVGLSEEALMLVDQTLAAIEGTSGRWYEAELSRLKGNLLMDCDQASASAEDCYKSAILVAKRQGALLWQLRATNALAKSWRDQGRNSEACALLTPLYSSFRPEATCADLREAQALLQETNGTPAKSIS
jgi:predicted ATPase